MTETKAFFETLRNSADQNVVAAIESVVRDGTDRQLCRINVMNFAAKHKLGEEKTISGFLHAARLGLFELTWNVLCPGCGGVLDATQTLKSVHQEAYECALCAAGCEPTLDEMVEVAFTVNPRLRRIAAHDPNSLPIWEYFQEIVASEGGAVVKTIGDAVMATFPTPDRAVAAALRMRDSVQSFRNDLLVKIGIHEGPCLAVTLNDRLDYFGQTVNIAVQSLADSRAIFVTKSVVENSQVSKILAESKIKLTEQSAALRGVADRMSVFQIP
jgi:Family of unknown function (DUF5939)/Adenylate and Guanylate cyclase catalytic domain